MTFESSKLSVRKKVSVVIVSYNRQDAVKDTVNSLLGQTEAPFEIIVIDDASDPPLKLCINSPSFRLVRFDNEVGLSCSRNCGIAVSKGEYIAFLDDDTIANSKWLEEINKGIASGADVLGGSLKPLFKANPPDWWNEKDFGGYAGVGNIYTEQIWGANMVFNREVFEKCGFFDSRLGRKGGKLLSCEEACLLNQVKANSGFVFKFVPRAEVLHIVPANRMTLMYIVKWSYFLGKSLRIIEGRQIKVSFLSLFGILMRFFNPFGMRCKSERIKKVVDLAMKFGRIF